jgi:hypothetical protein
MIGCSSAAKTFQFNDSKLWGDNYLESVAKCKTAKELYNLDLRHNAHVTTDEELLQLKWSCHPSIKAPYKRANLRLIDTVTIQVMLVGVI